MFNKKSRKKAKGSTLAAGQRRNGHVRNGREMIAGVTAKNQQRVMKAGVNRNGTTSLVRTLVSLYRGNLTVLTDSNPR